MAVQSHYFGIGGVVPWLEAGVGAVATQSFVEESYGPLGLALMRWQNGAAGVGRPVAADARGSAARSRWWTSAAT